MNRRRDTGIEPKIIQRAEANSVGVLILRKSFCAPGDGVGVLGNSPRCAAIPGVSHGAVVGEAWVLRWGVKTNISYTGSTAQGHTERLDGAIEVLVIERIFIMPDAGVRSCHFVTHEPDAIVAVIRFLLIYRGAGPSHDGWLLAHCVAG